MRPRRVGPVVIRRRLGAELRRLREGANMRLDAVADALEVSASKVSRLETGHGIPRSWDVRNLLTLYGVEDEKLRARLVGWANDGRATAWWQPYSDEIPGDLDYYISLEAEAAAIASYCTPSLHGLLQTRAYADALLAKVLPHCDAESRRRLVDIRLDRQQIITRTDEPVRLHVILDESALRRTVGSAAIMQDQMRNLVTFAELPHVTIQVFPFTAGAHQGMFSTFTIFTPRIRTIDPVVVNIESTEHDAYEEKPDRVQVFQAIFEDLQHRAKEPDKSIEMIKA